MGSIAHHSFFVFANVIFVYYRRFLSFVAFTWKFILFLSTRIYKFIDLDFIKSDIFLRVSHIRQYPYYNPGGYVVLLRKYEDTFYYYSTYRKVTNIIIANMLQPS